MERYTRKPQIINAVEWNGCNLHELLEWTGEGVLDTTQSDLMLNILNNNITLKIGDYIIRDENGKFYSLKPDEFKSTYDVIPEHKKNLPTCYIGCEGTLSYIYDLIHDYDGYREAENLMGLIDEVRDIIIQEFKNGENTDKE